MATRELSGELLDTGTTVRWRCLACHWDAYTESGDEDVPPSYIREAFERHQCKDHETVFI
jgi:hypothetical protein